MGSPRRLLRWLRLLVILVLIAAQSLAQPATPKDPDPPAATGDEAVDQRKHEAKQRFLKGLELVQNEDWDAALAEFLASRELFPTQVALKNAAISLRQLRRYAEALEMYRDLLARFGPALSADDRRVVNEAMAQLGKNVGRLEVVSNQPGCTVVIDGRQRGTTPLGAALEVDAGTHTVRVSKSGYETYEARALLAGGETKRIDVQLTALGARGTLVVSEVEGRQIDVVVDGAVVGAAPFSGAVAPGVHAVSLRGAANWGTPPISAAVRAGGTTTLRLRAEVLDSVLRVEPTPANAQVHVDGVALGNGVWEGRLKSGPHKVEVAAPGFVAHRGELVTRPGQTEVAHIALERDLSDPMWSAGFSPHLYVEAIAGVLWAPSLGGGADAACSEAPDCTRARPLGALAGARGGYQMTRALGLEVFLGVLYVREETERAIVASGENGDWTSPDYKDSTELFGPAGALSASYRFFETTPLTLRVWAGVARVSATFSNEGTFTGQVAYQPPSGPAETASSTERVSIPEKSARVWLPFVGPEVRFGYRLGKRVSVDLGVALLLMFPPDTPRTGRTTVSSREGDRKAAMKDVPLPSGNVGRGGVLSLPRENAFGTHYAIAPSIAGRFDL